MHRTSLSNILILFILILGSVIAGPEDWRIALCISEDPQHQMNVSWRTQRQIDTPLVQVTPNLPQVNFDKQAVDITAQTEVVVRSDGSLVYAYSAKMNGLNPSTAYAYRVGSKDEWSEWFVFETANNTETSFRFLYLGDPQNGLLTHVPRAIRAGYKGAPDAAFLTMAGDLVSVPGIDKQWEDLFHAGSWIFGTIPLVPVMGNHAYFIDGKWLDEHSTYWQPHFTLPKNGLATLPETNYYFQYQGMLFVVLNGNEQLDEQAIWLDEVLSQSEAGWFIVSMHQPLYSTAKGREGTKRRDAFLSVFDNHEVDLILQGHDHSFGRTYPLRNGKQVKGRQKGTVYINSVSGSKQYLLEPAIDGVFEVTGSEQQFYHVIDVQPSKLKLSSFTVDGELKDQIIIKPSRNR